MAEEITEPFSGTVEALNVTSTTIAKAYYEGAILVKATTQASQKEVKLPAGSWKVSTAQKNAALAFNALEVSFFPFNNFPLI